MSRQKFKARDRITQKMTRDGLVERNESTGEDNRISKRDADFDLRGIKPEHDTYSQVGNRTDIKLNDRSGSTHQLHHRQHQGAETENSTRHVESARHEPSVYNAPEPLRHEASKYNPSEPQRYEARADMGRNNAEPAANLIPGSSTTTGESPNSQGYVGKGQEQEYTHQRKVGPERSKQHYEREDCPTE